MTFVLVAVGLAAQVSSAGAAAPRDGWGFGIADDGGVTTLGTYFQALRPKTFRFMIPWDAGTAPDSAAQIQRAQQMIFVARASGVQHVAVSFDRRQNDESAPSTDAYIASVGPILQQLAPIVDAWGPANEPNCQGRWAGLGTAAGARRTAELYNILLFLIRVGGDPTATMLSPDFCDNFSGASVKTWMDEYKGASGGFGDFISWHPYWDAYFTGATRVGGVSSTQDLLNQVPANKQLWVTEVGGFGLNRGRGINTNDESKQFASESWIVNTLANHPRVSRVYHYHMQGGDPEWDTGLLRIDGSRRPGWFLWCAASHNNAGHPDCAGPPGQSRLAIVAGDGSVWLKEGLPGGAWLTMAATSANARDVELNGERLVMAWGDGTVQLKNGLPGAPNDLMAAGNFDTRDVELDGNRLALVAGNGSIWVKNGIPAGSLVQLADPSFGAKDVELSSSALAAIDGSGRVWYRNDPPGGTWDLLGGPEFAAKDVEIDGDRMAIIAGNGSVWLKNGLPGATWDMIGGPEFAAKDIELDGGRLALIAGNGAVWLKDGLPGGPWLLMADTNFAARDVELGGGRMAVIAGNGAVWLKNGLPGATWDQIGGVEFNARDLTLF